MVNVSVDMPSDDCKDDVSKCSCSKVLFFIKLTFHLIAWLIFVAVECFGFYTISTFTEEQLKDKRIYDVCYLSMFYLTNWNLCFQTTFLFLATAHDLLQWLDRHDSTLGRRLRYFRDVIFSGMMFPTTLFVTSMFWLVYAVDRELVFPRVFDSVVPWWFNHCVHTNITIVLVVETLLQARRYPVDRKAEIISCTVVNVGYAVVYYSIYFTTHRWLYGVFGTMNWWQVCLYQLAIWVSAAVFYYMQFPINRLIHGSEEDAQVENRNDDLNGLDGVVKINGSRVAEAIENGTTVLEGNAVEGDKAWNLKYRNIRDEFEQRTRK